MNYISLLSSITLLAASSIPFYFALKLRSGPRIFTLLSLTLGLALLIHGVHHALKFVDLILLSLVMGFISALLATLFAVLYYISWRSAVAQP